MSNEHNIRVTICCLGADDTPEERTCQIVCISLASKPSQSINHVHAVIGECIKAEVVGLYNTHGILITSPTLLRDQDFVYLKLKHDDRAPGKVTMRFPTAEPLGLSDNKRFYEDSQQQPQQHELMQTEGEDSDLLRTQRVTVVRRAIRPLVILFQCLSIPGSSEIPFLRRLVYPLAINLWIWFFWVLQIVARTYYVLSAPHKTEDLAFVTGWLATHILIAVTHIYLWKNFRVETLVNEVAALDFAGGRGESALWLDSVQFLRKDIRKQMVLYVVCTFVMWACMLEGEVQILIEAHGKAALAQDLARDYVVTFNQPILMFILRAVTLPISLLILNGIFLLFHVSLKVHELAIDALQMRIVHRQVVFSTALLEHQRIRASINHTSKFFQRVLGGVIFVLSAFSFESIYLLSRYLNLGWKAFPVGFYSFVTLTCFASVSFVISRTARLTNKCRGLVEVVNNMKAGKSLAEINDRVVLMQYLQIADVGYRLFGVVVANPSLIQFWYLVAYGAFVALIRIVAS